MKGWFLSFAFSLLTVFSCYAQANAIGFDRLMIHDSSRLFVSHHKEITVNYWFPGQRDSTAKPLFFKDYIFAASPFQDITGLAVEDERKLEEEVRHNLNYFGVTDDEFERILSMPARAVSAQMTGEKYPLVVVVGAAEGSNVYFTAFAESLSEKGIIVATFSSNQDTDGPCGHTIECVEDQVADVAKVVDDLKQRPWIDSNRISLVAWSLGGVSAAFYAKRYGGVKSIVSFDSALGYRYGVDLIKGAHNLEEAMLDVPIFHFQSIKSGRKTPQDMSYFNAMPGRLVRVYKSHTLTHAQFTSLYGPVLNYGKGGSEAVNRMIFMEKIIKFIRKNWM